MLEMNGAGDGIRTRDINLGKVALYQLSYSRRKPLTLTFSNEFVAKSIHLIAIQTLSERRGRTMGTFSTIETRLRDA